MWSKDQSWRRALRPRRRTGCDQPSADGYVAQLGTLRLGFPERPGEFDADSLTVGELEFDGVPAGHKVTVTVGLRDPDPVPGTGTPWSAVVPTNCLHRVKLPVGRDTCHAVVTRPRGLEVARVVDRGEVAVHELEDAIPIKELLEFKFCDLVHVHLGGSCSTGG